MSRRKGNAIHVPANKAEAEQMIAEYTALEREKMFEELAADEAKAKIAEQKAERLRELDAEASPLFDGLKAWFEVRGKDEIAMDKRSAHLAGATIGMRLTPPSLKTERKVTFKDVLAWLQALSWGRKKDFLRIKVELDKEAISKAMRSDDKVSERFAGRLRIVQTDEFFIDTGLDRETLKKQASSHS